MKMSKLMDRNEDGTLTENQIEKLHDIDDNVDQFKHFFNLYSILGNDRIDEFTELLIEAGHSIQHITKMINTASARSNFNRNTYIRDRVHSEGKINNQMGSFR